MSNFIYQERLVEGLQHFHMAFVLCSELFGHLCGHQRPFIIFIFGEYEIIMDFSSSN